MLQNLKNGVAAQGYDVVSFFDGNPQKGNEKLAVKYQDASYLFSSQKNVDTFKKNPEAYAPQYGGYCAIAMSEEKTVNPNPKSYVVQDGKLYFFTRLLFGLIDAKKQWVKAPSEKQALADKAYAKLNK